MFVVQKKLMLYTGQSEINNGTQVTTYDTFLHAIQNTTLGPDTVLCIAVYVEGLTVLWLAWHTNNHSGWNINTHYSA